MKQIRFLMQKYFLLAAAVWLATVPALAQNNANLGPNLVKNNSFEEGTAGWNIPPGTAEVVNGVAHDGEHSLHYKNTEEKRYKMFTQHIDAVPGQNLKFSAWIKGKGIVGPASEGASIFIQSYAGETYQSGSFPGRLSGTFDWKQITGNFLVPEGATKVSVGLYLRKGVTGEAWFDDVEVRVEKPAPFVSHLLFPNYRGMVKVGDETDWKFGLQINKQQDWPTNSIKIQTVLTDKTGKALLENNTRLLVEEDHTIITFGAPTNLSVGEYTLRQTVFDPNGNAALQEEHPIRIVAQMPKVYVDAGGFTVVDGKRFFPMGVYLGGDSNGEEHLKRIGESGFNTVLSYSYGARNDAEAFVGTAQKHGLKVVYSVKDMYPTLHKYGEEAYDVAAGYIERLRDHPAILGWYTNDELGENWLPQLSKMYEQVKRLDPNHPTFQVLYQMAIMKKYFSVTDILGADPYPVGSADLTKTARDTRIAVEASHGANGVWMVPQMFDWGVLRENRKIHPPSRDEMRNQAYQMIINGATGLIWYDYYDIKYKAFGRTKENIDMDLFNRRWADSTAMAREIGQIIPTILNDQKVLLDIPENSAVEAAVWQEGDKLLFLLANPYYQEKSLTIPLPYGWRIKDTNQGQIKGVVHNDQLTFTLPSIGSGTYRLVRN